MTLYDFIKKNTKLARKIFGKVEIEIIKKQLRGINLSQSEKNRLSRDIRPKFEFIKKCSVFKDEFDIKKGGDIYKKLDKLKNQILLDDLGRKINNIYLFGSFVENKMSNNSDVDIAVEFDEITLKKASLFKKRFSNKLEGIFDLSVYNNLSESMKKEVKKNGRLYYSNK